MPISARFFLCARCRSQVTVCRSCDSGQQYCAGECSALARRERQREANQRYSRTHRARVLNAKRQHRHRLRRGAHKPNKVTDQASPALSVCPTSDPIDLSASRSRLTGALVMHRDEVFCHFCHCVCADRVRLEFLSPGQRRRNIHRSLSDP